MTLLRLSCDCGREYAFSVDEGEEEEAAAEEEGASVDASRQTQADEVLKRELEVDATPSYEDADDPFWAPDKSDENETRIHETDPIGLRPRPRPKGPRTRQIVGFARATEALPK